MFPSAFFMCLFLSLFTNLNQRSCVFRALITIQYNFIAKYQYNCTEEECFVVVSTLITYSHQS